MAKKPLVKSTAASKATRSRRSARAAGRAGRPLVRWTQADGRRLLVLENGLARISLWPDMGGAIVSHIDRASGIDIIWRNSQCQPARSRALDQPMAGGSDLFDVMDGSWYVSLPTGFHPESYFGAPIGTHGELRSLPWTVDRIERRAGAVSVKLTGRSVRTPLVYRRKLTLRRGSALLHWVETVENRSAETLPVVWLQHPTFGGPLLDGARLLAPARTVRVFKADDPTGMQLESGYQGSWPLVPEREGGRMRDCSVVPAAGSGLDHTVQLTGFDAGWGCVWNEAKRLGFAIEWDRKQFPYAWSWASAGGILRYPLWGEGHLITLQPSTSPVGRFAEVLKSGELLQVPGRGAVSTAMATGFVTTPSGPWTEPKAST